MVNANNKVNYKPSIKQKEKKYSLSTVLAWLYLKTIGRILPGRWNQWAENILHHNKVIVNNGVQTDAPEVVDQSVQISEVVAQEVQSKIISEGKTTFKDTEIQTEFVETEDKNEKLKEQLEGVSQALGVFIGLYNNQAQQIEDLELENEELKSKLAGLKKNYSELVEIAQKRGEEFLAQFKEKSEEILHLQKELIECSKEFANKTETLSVKVGEKDAKIGSLTQLNERLEQEKKEMENKKNEQQQTIFTKDQKIKEQEDLINSFRENKDINETVKKENENLQAQNTELENEVSKLKKEFGTQIKQLESQLEEKQAELEQAKEKDAELEDLRKKLKSTQQQLEKDKSDWEGKLNAAEIKKKDLESEVNKLQEKVQTLEESKEWESAGTENQAKADTTKLEEEKKGLLAEIDQLKRSLSSTPKQLEQQQLSNNQEQQKLQNKQKDASKKPEDINKETKALDAKSIFSTSGSVKLKFSNTLSKLRGNDSLDKFLSDQNTKLKKSFPEFEGKHFCHNVLKETIQSLPYQNGYKFKSDKLLALLEENLVKSGKEIIEDRVKQVVTEVGKKHSIKNGDFVKNCVNKLYLNEEDSKAILNSFTVFLANRNDSNNDSCTKFVVQKLTKAQMELFSINIQVLELASSIRDTFLSPNQGMCNQTQGGVNEYQLTKKAKEKYKLTPNPSMSHTNSTPVSVKQEAMSR
ncbi:coiled-coil domain-containing protein [Wolbachia endosymbiont (group B) of Athalia cordata]|uniref:hypothetical protein n=1 Tax=Wolbachia endosymbiont (group B) of Athalia cordata TaxID=2953986 RepID=UPI00223221B4|nr:hypothetical protein [Wolbachia endosymbiont (group B) of Athalia cordata]